MDDATCWMNIGLLQYRSVLWHIIAAYWSFDIVMYENLYTLFYVSDFLYTGIIYT